MTHLKTCNRIARTLFEQRSGWQLRSPPPDSRQKVATVAAAACAMLAESCAILLMLFAIAALPRSSEATQKLARRSADRITAGNRVLV